ncbi:MAG: hypothetical protein CSA65_04090 [Proteobacteria bacterium]|nr:MAG: hypothetical protein CSA65_04090 [Pseudomonadota bacterium]
MSPERSTTPTPALRALLWLAFGLSGVAGLSYELVWVRYVGRLVGGSTQSIAATVALFFAGLALGAWLGGRVFQQLRRPLLGYAALEAAIGLVAATVPATLGWLEHTSAAVDSLPLAFALATLPLLPATALLGATFPAMAAVVADLTDVVDGTARFYGFNTAGAVLGCLLTSLWLLPSLGHRQTNWVMVGIDLVVAASLAAVAWRLPPALQQPDEVAPAAPGSDAPRPPPQPLLSPRIAATLALVSGLLAIGVEVLWTRALSLSFPATVYVFAVVLAAYLFGVALGALLTPRLSRRLARAPLLAGLYAFTGLGVLLSALAFPRLADAFYGLVAAGRVESWQGWIGGIGLTSLAAMLPSTLAMGAALPLLIGLASPADQRSSTAGRLYTLNVLGGVIGSLMTTFTLMPAVGLSPALGLLACAYLALPLGLSRPLSLRRGVVLASALALALAAAGALSGLAPEVDPDRAPGPQRRLLYARDSASGTIAIYERGRAGRVPIRALKVNTFYGLNITAPSTIAMQYRLGYLPLALHPRPRRALLVGFATGNTLAAMADVSDIEELSCVELHGDLFALARYFEPVNRGVWRLPKVRLVAGDGRRFMLRKSPRYDVIVGDLYLPRNPGVGSLYSLEHFRAVRARLRPAGVFVAWLPLWQLSPDETGVIVRTFLTVFPGARGALGNAHAMRPVLGLLGARQTALPPIPWKSLEQQVQRALRRVYGAGVTLPSAPTAAGAPDISHTVLRRWAAGRALNTLENAWIEYSAPRTLTHYQLRQASPAADNLRYLAKLRSSAPR